MSAPEQCLRSLAFASDFSRSLSSSIYGAIIPSGTVGFQTDHLVLRPRSEPRPHSSIILVDRGLRAVPLYHYPDRVAQAVHLRSSAPIPIPHAPQKDDGYLISYHCVRSSYHHQHYFIPSLSILLCSRMSLSFCSDSRLRSNPCPFEYPALCRLLCT